MSNKDRNIHHELATRFSNWVTEVCFQAAILLTVLSCSDFAIISFGLFENIHWLKLACSIISMLAVLAWFNVLFRLHVSKWLMFAIFIAIIVTFLMCLNSLMLCIITYGASNSLVMMIVFIVFTVVLTLITVDVAV